MRHWVLAWIASLLLKPVGSFRMGAEKLNHLDQKTSYMGLHVRAELRPQSITRPTRTTEHVFSKMPGQQKLRRWTGRILHHFSETPPSNPPEIILETHACAGLDFFPHHIPPNIICRGAGECESVSGAGLCQSTV